MTREWKEKFWKSLEADLRKLTDEVRLQNPKEETYLLQSLFTTLQGGKGVALFEAQMYDYGAQGEVLEIVVTPQEYKVEESAMAELEKAVSCVNFFTPLGAFGVHVPSKQLFLRYVMPVEETMEQEKLVESIRKVYGILGSVFGNVYEAMEAISAGKSTYEKETEAGKFPAQ